MIGVGVDVVDIERFRRSLARTPSMRTRLFTDAELDSLSGRIDDVPGLAARFAAREASMKALGLGLGAFGFHDVSVAKAESGAPSFELATEAGVERWHLSLSHGDSVAIAQVVAE